jgi:hypothetical protein
MTDKEFFKFIKKLNTPIKIQDFLNTLEENKTDNIFSPKKAIENKKAHCLEGALIAHCAFILNNKVSFLLDIRSKKSDLDHVVTLFKEDGLWGAISKTFYPVLRFRDPVFKSARELVMSYFPEYFLENGEKTMIDFSTPFSLEKRDNSWMTTEEDLYEIGWEIDSIKHFDIAPKKVLKKLRKADTEEILRVFNKNN